MQQRDSVLVYVSSIRRQFSGAGTTSDVTERPPDIHSLVDHLGGRDPLVSFLSSKALTAVLLVEGAKERWLRDVLQVVNGHSITSHVGVYGLQVVSGTLKALRKHRTSCSPPRHTSCCDAAISACLSVLSWSELLQLFTHPLPRQHCPPGPTHTDAVPLRPPGPTHNTDAASLKKKWIEQSLTEFLSLTLEVLRCRGNMCCHGDTPDAVTECQLAVATNLACLSSVVSRSASVGVLKRFSGVLLKVLERPALLAEGLQHLPACLQETVSSPAFRLVWDKWTNEQGPTPGDSIPTNKQGPTPDIGLVNTAMRKAVVVLLKYVLSSQQHQADVAGLEELLSSLSRSLPPPPIAGPVWSKEETARASLLRLVSEQDDCLSQVLLLSCSLHNNTSLSSDPSLHPALSALLSVVDVHRLVLQFLASISFDHSTLLDLLISPETGGTFTLFLGDYLTTLATEWGARTHETGPSKERRPSPSGAGLREPERKRAKVCGERDDEGWCLLDSGSHSPPGESEEDRMVECFTRLRFALQRLLSRDLLQQPAAASVGGIVGLLERVEDIHEEQYIDLPTKID